MLHMYNVLAVLVDIFTIYLKSIVYVSFEAVFIKIL